MKNPEVTARKIFKMFWFSLDLRVRVLPSLLLIWNTSRPFRCLKPIEWTTNSTTRGIKYNKMKLMKLYTLKSNMLIKFLQNVCLPSSTILEWLKYGMAPNTGKSQLKRRRILRTLAVIFMAFSGNTIAMNLSTDTNTKLSIDTTYNTALE